jgi:hypothetical protein
MSGSGRPGRCARSNHSENDLGVGRSLNAGASAGIIEPVSPTR